MERVNSSCAEMSVLGRVMQVASPWAINGKEVGTYCPGGGFNRTLVCQRTSVGGSKASKAIKE